MCNNCQYAVKNLFFQDLYFKSKRYNLPLINTFNSLSCSVVSLLLYMLTSAAGQCNNKIHSSRIHKKPVLISRFGKSMSYTYWDHWILILKIWQFRLCGLKAGLMFTSQLLHKHFFWGSVNNDTNPVDLNISTILLWKPQILCNLNKVHDWHLHNLPI
jgi:hypothetical protein